jgi:hypothetical protein
MRWVVLPLAALLGGCGVTTTNIAVGDRNTFLPSARMSIDISPKADAPSVPHSGHGIEIGLTGGRGKDNQDVAAGSDPVIFGNTTFNAPVALEHEFDFRYGELAYRFRRFFGSAREFGIEVLGGVGYAELDLTVASATQRANEQLGNGGIVGGFGILWKFRSTTSFQARLAAFVSDRTEGVTSATRVDAYIAQALGRHAALRAGFAAWTVRSERENEFAARKSPIEARFSGPSLGLDVMF